MDIKNDQKMYWNKTDDSGIIENCSVPWCKMIPRLLKNTLESVCFSVVSAILRNKKYSLFFSHGRKEKHGGKNYVQEFFNGTGRKNTDS